MVHCIICDYDLHGLDPAGNCPECGNPIARSMRGDLLRYADQEWVRGVERGLRLVFRGLMAMLFTYAAAIAGVLLVALLRDFSGVSYWVWTIGGVLTTLSAGAGTIAMIIGLWMATAIEPRVQSRSGVQPLLLRGLSLAVVPWIALWSMGDPALGWNVPPWMFDVIAWAAFIIVSLHMLMFIKHLQSLDRRCEVKDVKRNQILEKYRSQGLGCVVILGTLGAVATIGSTAPIWGGGTMPLNVMRIVILIWLAVISFARGTLRNVQLERVLAHELPRTS